MNAHSLAVCFVALGIACGALAHAESIVLQNVRVIDGNGGPPIDGYSEPTSLPAIYGRRGSANGS